MVEKLIRIAREHGEEKEIVEKKIHDLLEEDAQSKHKKSGKRRKYRDLVEGQCRIEHMFRIDRTNDPNTISSKIFDFSYSTINHLREQGYKEGHKLIE